jgi:quercetin dioxygenase-like cupin family protein
MHSLKHSAARHAAVCTRAVTLRLAAIPAVLAGAACDGSTPTATAQAPAAADVVVAPAPFTARAPLDPFRVHQLPDFMAHSADRTDFVVQRLVLPPGPVAWHTHPGPSFVIIEAGLVRVQHVSEKTGCVESPILGAGHAFIRAGNEVHRLTVLGTSDAVLYAARFNVPVGGAITIPAEDPDC